MFRRGCDSCHNIADLRAAARRRLPRGLFEFVDRGVEDERTLHTNRGIFNDVRLIPRVMRDVECRSLETRILDQDFAMPVVVAPTGAAGLLWYKGEVALARAARRAKLPFTLATGSIASIEEVAESIRRFHAAMETHILISPLNPPPGGRLPRAAPLPPSH